MSYMKRQYENMYAWFFSEYIKKKNQERWDQKISIICQTVVSLSSEKPCRYNLNQKAKIKSFLTTSKTLKIYPRRCSVKSGGSWEEKSKINKTLSSAEKVSELLKNRFIISS